MSSALVDQWLKDANRAIQTRQMDNARRLLEQTLSVDGSNIEAWFLFGTYIIPPENRVERNQIFDKARLQAIQSEQSLQFYARLLEQHGAAKIPIYVLQSDSESVGARCPITTVTFKPGDLVVVCPGTCHTAHDVDAWEYNGYECAVCGQQTALIDRSKPPIPQPARANTDTIVINTSDIDSLPEAPNRETLDENFTERVRDMMVSDMVNAFMTNLGRQVREAEAEKRARAQFDAELAKMERFGTRIGLVPALLIGIGIFQMSGVLEAVALTLLTILITRRAARLSKYNDIDFRWMIFGLLPQLTSSVVLISVLTLNASAVVALIAAAIAYWVANRLITQKWMVKGSRAIVILFVIVVIALWIII